jgi:uncharacterized membrane protein
MRSVALLRGSADAFAADVPAGTERVFEPLSMVGDIGPMVVAGGVLVLLGLGAVALWRSGVTTLLPFTVSGYSEGDSPTDANSTAVGAEARSSSAVAAESTHETAARSRVDEEQQSEQEEQSDPELIVEILEEHDGRMRQAAIVDETEWSKSKVSMVLSEMEDDGHISKLRVGRENIVSLTGNEPEAAGSPFDDE